MLRKPVTLGVAEEGELRMPGECLRTLGLEAGARGTIQVSPEKLLFLPSLEVREAQAEITALAEEMEAEAAALDRLVRGLMRPPGAAETEAEAGLEARDALECILHDELRPAIRKLRKASEAIAEGS